MEGHDIKFLIHMYYQAYVPTKEYMDDRSIVPAMREFVDSCKHFIK